MKKHSAGKGTFFSFVALFCGSLVETAFTPYTAVAVERQVEGRGVYVAIAAAAQPEQPTAEQYEPADVDDRDKTKLIRFDVTENSKRFIFDETPLFPDGAPAYGNEFVTEGYIYPYGTLQGTSGVNPDGSPQFADKVIGRWVCRGWHVGEGAKTVTGPWVITHQIYDFGNKPGRETIVTDGFELVDVNVAIRRAIVGGTGMFSEARGEAIQTMLGFNQLNGVNLRFELKVAVR